MLLNKFSSKHLFILIIPAFYFVWSLVAANLSGPFFLTRCDPEYPYLLNGLNFARLDFSRIGHIDHPGTPFQMITGIFIQITYWIAGQGSMVDDVISRPEVYLSFASFYLTLITVAVIIWLGKIVVNSDKSIWEAVILQSSILINVLLIDLPSRYIPDRLMAVLVLVLAGLCFKLIYIPEYYDKKFALHSGILTGIGFIIKVNFLPVLAIPLILINKWKIRLRYIGIFLLSAFISLIPIYDKISGTRYFLTSIIKHDGLYGKGSEQMINLPLFWNNIFLIFKQNNSFFLILIAAILVILFLLIKSSYRKTFIREFHFLIAFLVVSAVGILITAKHYKGYYIIPMISIAGFTFLIIFNISRKLIRYQVVNAIFISLLVVMIFLPLKYVCRAYPVRMSEKLKKMRTHYFYENSVSPDDYIFIEPTWFSGPMITNGLAYGLSYIAYRHYYYNEFERYYPNALTWNNKNRHMKYLHMIDADNEAILKSGKSIYVLSSPWRHADMLCNYIDSCASISGIIFLHDTVFVNPETSEIVIRLSNNSAWKTIADFSFGFETVKGDSLFSNDGNNYCRGEFEISDKESGNRFQSLKLSSNHRKSPKIFIQPVTNGDYLEITVKRRKNHDETKGNILLSILRPDNTLMKVAEGKLIGGISSNWELLRLRTTINTIPEGSKLWCYYDYPGDKEEFIDDLVVKHFSSKSRPTDHR